MFEKKKKEEEWLNKWVNEREWVRVFLENFKTERDHIITLYLEVKNIRLEFASEGVLSYDKYIYKFTKECTRYTIYYYAAIYFYRKK